MLYAIGLPLLVLLFLRRHRNELTKPVVRFRYGLFFAGFREEKYYWEVVVAMRKESTVILAIFGSQLGVAMLAHVALFVFMIQLLFQLIGNPYNPMRHKLQIMDIMSICICWFTMWSGFFFYTPRPPSQKPALEALTIFVVLANALFMLALLYFMCSETCKEHKDNVILKEIRNRTTSMHLSIKRISGLGKIKRRTTQNFRNPSLDAHLKVIELAAMTQASAQGETTKNKKKKRNSRATIEKKRQGKNVKRKSRPETGAATSQQNRRIRLQSLLEKKESANNTNTSQCDKKIDTKC